MRAYLYIIFTLIGMLLIPSLVHAIHHLTGLQELPNSVYDPLPGPPIQGTGYYKYEPITPPSGCEPKDGEPSTMYWGSPAVTNAPLLNLTRRWEQERRNEGFCPGPGTCALIGIGDMSLYYGGPVGPPDKPCHGGHQHGLSVDFRLQRKDGKPSTPDHIVGNLLQYVLVASVNKNGDYLYSLYSHKKTKALIVSILEQFSTNVKCIYLNDPKMARTILSNGRMFPSLYRKHHNHIHLELEIAPSKSDCLTPPGTKS